MALFKLEINIQDNKFRMSKFVSFYSMYTTKLTILIEDEQHV